MAEDDPNHDVAAALTSGGVLPELTYRAAVNAFGHHGAAELCYLAGLYCLVSVTLNGFDVWVPRTRGGKSVEAQEAEASIALAC